MKKPLCICCAGLLSLLCACSPAKSDIRATERVRLPAGVSVAGVNLSRVRMDAARSGLCAALEEPVFTFALPGGDETLSAGALGIRYDIDAALLAASRGESLPHVALAVDDTVLSARLDRLAAQLRETPRDASVAVDPRAAEPFRYTEEVDGRAVDMQALRERIHWAVERGSFRIEVPCVPVTPVATVAELRAQRQPVASYTSSFSEYPHNNANRIFNIKKAAARIHGTVLAPGEEFDCNAVLGDRNAQNGWREAAAIRDGAYLNEYGGGVCQVSSTLFNAVMMADLTVTERSPHSWPMAYVAIGRDATISTGGKNFRFVNSTASEITVGAWVDERKMSVTCTIYGTPPQDGRTVKICSVQTGRLEEAPEEILLDESLPFNTRIVARTARRGKTSKTYKAYYDAKGALLEEVLAYEDVYRSIPARIFVSTDIYYS